MGTSVPFLKFIEAWENPFPRCPRSCFVTKLILVFVVNLLIQENSVFAQPLPASANTPTVSDGITFYMNKPSILIPFNMDPNNPLINSILLHVSEDLGRTWRYIGYAQPNQKSFQFQAPRDGWYWFAIQAQDRQGRYSPQTMSQAMPGLKICVDRVPPQIYLKGTATTAGSATVDWDIRDENLDLATLRFESRPAGSTEWTPLSVQPLAQGGHAWNLGPGQFDVRLLIRDKSGNLGEQTVLLVPGQTKTAGVQGASLGAVGATAAQNGVPNNVLMVNHKQFQLNFKLEDVGPSDVARIEVWFTRDGGRTWRKFEQDAPKSPPCKLEVPEEGRYGFTLIARSGVELSEPPPKTGDLPHIWVEVDETKPQLRLLGAEVGRGVDQGTMTIMWTAADKFLGPTPITLSYGPGADGPWTPAAKDLPNTGRYVWKLPDQGIPYQFFIKLDCSDLAGNKATAITPSVVKVDLATPKARVVGVSAVGIAPETPGEASTPGTPGAANMNAPLTIPGTNTPGTNNPANGTSGGGSTGPMSPPPATSIPVSPPTNTNPVAPPTGNNPAAKSPAPANPFPGVETPKPPPTETNPLPGGANTGGSNTGGIPPAPPSSPASSPPGGNKPQPLPSSPSNPPTGGSNPPANSAPNPPPTNLPGGPAPGNPTSQTSGNSAFPGLPPLPPA